MIGLPAGGAHIWRTAGVTIMCSGLNCMAATVETTLAKDPNDA